MISFRLKSNLKLISFLLISLSSFLCKTGLTEDNIFKPKERIVALTSLSADLVNSISNESLIAIPGTSLFKNRNEFKDKIIISQGRTPPNLEKIISLKPTLVIGSKGFHDITLKKLNEFGVKTISAEIKKFSDLEDLSKSISKYTNTHDFSLKNKIPNCYNLDLDKKESTLVMVSSKPILSPNSKSWSGNLLRRFNINNLSSDLESKSSFRGYANISSEWLVSENPKNIIVISTPGSDISQYRQLPYWNKLNAVKKDNIYEFEYYGFINPGSTEAINNACIKLKAI